MRMVGVKLDLFRRGAGLTVVELARMSGVPKRTVERILQGRNQPTAAHFLLLIRTLRVSLAAFSPEDFEGEGV